MSSSSVEKKFDRNGDLGYSEKSRYEHISIYIKYYQKWNVIPVAWRYGYRVALRKKDYIFRHQIVPSVMILLINENPLSRLACNFIACWRDMIYPVYYFEFNEDNVVELCRKEI